MRSSIVVIALTFAGCASAFTPDSQPAATSNTAAPSSATVLPSSTSAAEEVEVPSSTVEKASAVAVEVVNGLEAAGLMDVVSGPAGWLAMVSSQSQPPTMFVSDDGLGWTAIAPTVGGMADGWGFQFLDVAATPEGFAATVLAADGATPSGSGQLSSIGRFESADGRHWKATDVVVSHKDPDFGHLLGGPSPLRSSEDAGLVVAWVDLLGDSPLVELVVAHTSLTTTDLGCVFGADAGAAEFTVWTCDGRSLPITAELQTSEIPIDDLSECAALLPGGTLLDEVSLAASTTLGTGAVSLAAGSPFSPQVLPDGTILLFDLGSGSAEPCEQLIDLNEVAASTVRLDPAAATIDRQPMPTEIAGMFGGPGSPTRFVYSRVNGEVVWFWTEAEVWSFDASTNSWRAYASDLTPAGPSTTELIVIAEEPTLVRHTPTSISVIDPLSGEECWVMDDFPSDRLFVGDGWALAATVDGIRHVEIEGCR